MQRLYYCTDCHSYFSETYSSAFFDDLRALTRYMVLTSWEHLHDLMIRELELAPPPS